jgi:hypothetical protein
MHIKIQYAHRADLFEGILNACMVGPRNMQSWRCHEQPFGAYLDKAKRTTVINHDVNALAQ